MSGTAPPNAARRLATTVTLLLALLAGAAVTGAPAAAHVPSSTGYAQLRQGGDGNDVSVTLMLDIALLVGDAGLGDGTSHSPAQLAGAARTLSAEAPTLAGRLGEQVRVYVDGLACRPRLAGTGVAENLGTVYGRLDVEAACPGSFDGSYQLEYDAFTTPGARTAHDALIVAYQLAGESGRTVLDRRQASLSVGEGSALAAAGRFVLLGGKHILLGWDHLLFVLALLLGARRVRHLVTVASLFTLAHSVTLVTTALGVVEVPASVVEPLIALSITYVALENLLGGGVNRRRMATVFGFGLLHGMGFAGSLRMDDELSWGLLGALLSFNAGIELGQVLVLVLAFPLVLLLRRSRRAALTLTGGTLAVAVVGAAWFLQRVTAV